MVVPLFAALVVNEATDPLVCPSTSSAWKVLAKAVEAVSAKKAEAIKTREKGRSNFIYVECTYYNARRMHEYFARDDEKPRAREWRARREGQTRSI